MGRRDRIEVLRTNLDDHPAFRAWRRLDADGEAPREIQILKAKSRAVACRMLGSGPGGTSVIAKWSLRCEADLERTLYERVLPHLPVPTPGYFGTVEADGEHCWQFLEDVGGRRFDRDDPTHRALAARWLGRVHIAATNIPAAAALPDRGPGHYLEHVRTARSTLRRALENPALDADATALIESAIDRCDFVEPRWDRLPALLEGARTTLVHGDFAPKNLCIRDVDGGPELIAFDWGESGWAVPTTDLCAVDLPAYAAVVREVWPDLDERTLAQLAEIGRMFRCVAAIDWEAPYFEFEWLERAIPRMRTHIERLDTAVRAVGWSP